MLLLLLLLSLPQVPNVLLHLFLLFSFSKVISQLLILLWNFLIYQMLLLIWTLIFEFISTSKIIIFQAVDLFLFFPSILFSLFPYQEEGLIYFVHHKKEIMIY